VNRPEIEKGPGGANGGGTLPAGRSAPAEAHAESPADTPGSRAAAASAPASPAVAPPIFALRNLSFSYGGPFRLEVDELLVSAGERLAIVGHNGSGKTTLLRVLAGLESAQTTVPLTRPRGERVGFLKQDPYLFGDSVAGNLAYPLKMRRLPADEVRRRVDAMLLLIGLEGTAARPAHKLSGGERKRVALGRVLVSEPDMLLLDEPDAYLDRHSQDVVEQILDHTRATLILTTHDLRFAHRVAQQVVHLREGRISTGLPANVLAGEVRDGMMVTWGGLTLHLGRPPAGEAAARPVRVALDPRSLVLSRAPLDSSMLNHFCGRVRATHDQNGSVWVEVALGPETLTAIISRESYEHLGLNLNQEVWISFKAHAVEIL
jgi:molybdopterin-binding protein